MPIPSTPEDTGHTPTPIVELRVWWIPQIPMQGFFYSVPTIEAGQMLCEALARYDLFQLEHNIKPDFSNAGGVSWRHPILTEGEWWDFEPTDEDECAEVREAMKATSPSHDALVAALRRLLDETDYRLDEDYDAGTGPREQAFAALTGAIGQGETK